MDLTNTRFYSISTLYGGIKMNLKFKEGQTYICKDTIGPVDWWTEGKEYQVIVNDEVPNSLVILDDDGDLWDEDELNDAYVVSFTLKEEKNND